MPLDATMKTSKCPFGFDSKTFFRKLIQSSYRGVLGARASACRAWGSHGKVTVDVTHVATVSRRGATEGETQEVRWRTGRSLPRSQRLVQRLMCRKDLDETRRVKYNLCADTA